MMVIIIILSFMLIWITLSFAAISFIRFVRDEIRCVRYRRRFYRQFKD